ncbi:chromo domain-containing protein [Xylariales sp. AK1849]|nr:chromo domain-containing protein [Xylariales sp. AK1849]
MPPAISDDEMSEGGDVSVPIATKRAKNVPSDYDNEEPEVIKGDVEDIDDAEGAEEDDDQEMEPDEFVVEKILGHVWADGVLKYKVKWEGYAKAKDQTWEEEDNLKENASTVLQEYLARVGGREKIINESKAGIKNKKRGRPASGTPTNGSKKSKRTDSHPASATPPASAAKEWKPPAGSWEEQVASIDACHDENTGKLIVYLTWQNGNKTQHNTKIVYQRCPQKMLQFYEQHVKIVKSASEAGLD